MTGIEVSGQPIGAQWAPIVILQVLTKEDGMEGTFQNEWHHLRSNLLHTSGLLRLCVNKILEQYELTQQQFNILRILRGAEPEPLSVARIKERLLDKSSDVPRLLERMLRKNYITKVENPNDRRQAEIRLCVEGKRILSLIDEEMPRLDELMQGLTIEEVQQLNQLLDKLAHHLQKNQVQLQ